MESEFLLNIKDISWEVIVISILVFGLTMLIKWPIKNATSKLEENKRKAVNTVIVFIPMILSLILSALYYGIFRKEWFTSIVFDVMGSSYLLAVAIYAIYSRIVILIKGAKSTTNSETSNLSKETIAYIKKNIKTISSALKVDEKNLTSIVNKIDSLLTLKDEVLSNTSLQDIAATESIDNQINELQAQKQELESSINKSQEELEAYKNSIN